MAKGQKNRWIQVLNLLSPIKNLFYHFWKNEVVKAFIIIILVLSTSFGLYLISTFKLTGNELIDKFSGKGSELIIAGGFFAILFKALRLSNFFKEDLLDVIFGKRFLGSTTDQFKELAWKNVTECLYASKHPDISAQINERIFKEIIPDDFDKHHTDAKSYLTIVKHDEEHIRIEHTDSFTIITSEKGNAIDSKYLIDATLNNGDLTDMNIESYKVNGEELASDILYGAWKKQRKMRQKEITLKKDIVVPLSGTLEVTIKATTILNKHMSLFWRKNFLVFTKTAEVYIDVDDSNLLVDFQPFGYSRNFMDIGEPIGKTFKKNMEILFPGDGYIIFVNIK